MQERGFSYSKLSALLFAVFMLAACGDDDTDGVSNDIDEDPRDVLMELFRAAENEDTETVYQRLSSPFHQVEYGEEWMWRFLLDGSAGLSHLSLRSSLPLLNSEFDPEDWNVQEQGDYVVVRHESMPEFSYVFRVEDDAWRWDPGQTMLGVAYYDEAHARDRDVVQGEPFLTVQGEIESTADSGPFGAALISVVTSVSTEGDELSVGIEWRPNELMLHQGDQEDAIAHLYEDIVVPVDEIGWESGDDSGEVEVVWTSGILENDVLKLPGMSEEQISHLPDDHRMMGVLTHRATLRLIDVPPDASEIVLRTEGVEIGPFGRDTDLPEDDAARIDLVYTFAAESSSEIFNTD